MKSQNQRILEALESGPLTGLQAVRAVGTLKLASRVSELRAEGWQIADRWITVAGRNGRKRVKQYFLP
jgi:hypothetical protein